MAVGIRDNHEQEIANFDTEEPFLSAPRRRLWKPTNKMHLTPEMHRRWSVLKRGRKPGSQWSCPDVMSWLRSNPIDDHEDVKYIQEKVFDFKSNLIANVSRLELGTTMGANDVVWSGSVPYLRLIHCLLDHVDIRSAYERSLGSAPQSKPIVYDILANKWNDENYNPVTEVYPFLHEEFSHEIDIRHSAVSHFGIITPENIRNILNAMRIRLGFIVSRWERSKLGEKVAVNGDGAVISDDIFCVDGHDDRSSFLQGDSPYLLYLWQKSHRVNFMSKILVGKNSKNQEADKVPSIIRIERSSACSDGSSLTDHMGVTEMGKVSKCIVDASTRETGNLIDSTKLGRINALDKMVLEIMSRIESLEDRIEKTDSGDCSNRSVARWKQSLQQYQIMLKEKNHELQSLRNGQE
jgi:hypothetical protein